MITFTVIIGYALDTKTLHINGTAKVYAFDDNFSVRFKKTGSIYETPSNLNNATSDGATMESYSNENTLLQISSLALPTENVTDDTNVTVLVKVKNLSDIVYKFNGIRYLKDSDLKDFPAFSVVNDNPNIKIDETSFADFIGKTIAAKSIEETGIMTIPIRFKYVNIDNIQNNILNF